MSKPLSSTFPIPKHVRAYNKRDSAAEFEASKRSNIPLIGKFVFDRLEGKRDAFKTEIDRLKKCFPDTFRNIRHVKPILPGSVGSLGHILFSYKEMSVLGLYGLYNMKPISMFSPVRNEIVVLDKEAWKKVPIIYSEGKFVMERMQPAVLCKFCFLTLV